MRRLLLALVTFLVCSLAVHAQMEKRSGCCSYHGGVCGCACCDGTPLSATCAPYYPTCGGGGGDTYTAPSNLGGSPATSTSCILTWTDNSFGEDSFQIEDHEIHQSTYLLVKTVPGNTTSTVIDHLNPGTSYSFRVRAHSSGNNSSYSNTTTVTTYPNPGSLCQAPAICFNQSRFNVTASWKTSDGLSGTGNIVRLTDDSGYFWFFDQTNVEVVFKVINGCGLNSSFWFYAGGLTNVQVTLTVTDTKTGAVKTYTNAQGRAFQPIQDTSAFTTCP